MTKATGIKEHYKNLLVEKIKSLQGVKAMTLAFEVCSTLPNLGGFDITELLEELVAENRLIEIEYMVPDTEQLKSFYFPANTQISVKGTGNNEWYWWPEK